MTTAQSPPEVLKAQADEIAARLKRIERGDVTLKPHELPPSRGRQSVSFAVVMDDKILTIELNWETIRTADEKEISEFILKRMRESRK